MSQPDSQAKRKPGTPRRSGSGTATKAGPSSTPAASVTRTGRQTNSNSGLPTASLVAEQPAGDPTTHACCRRFEFTEGFLLDTVTGQLWLFDKDAVALFAVPRLDTVAAVQAAGQSIMDKVQKMADAYAQMLSAVSLS